MQIKYIFIVIILFLTNNLLAQKDSIIQLDEIVLPISKIKNFSKGYYTQFLSDTIIKKNNASLTDVLRYNSFLYFKENGYGMVSSPSFRGTNASQTAVVWNGININSQLNGQTDFNTIEVNSLNIIAVRNGGGSVLFGSGAIGGTILLNNVILFKNQESRELSISYGSFTTFNTCFKGTISSEKAYLNATVSYNTSKNDYSYLETSLMNENGSFYNLSFNGNLGYKFNTKNQLKYYTTTFFGDRNLSRTLTAPSKSKYKNITTKNLLEWNYFINSNEIFTLKTALLGREYTYLEDKDKPHLSSVGNSIRIIGVVDYKKKISSKVTINTIFSYENTTGKGDNLQQKTRNNFSGVVLLNHKLNKWLSYGVQFRKEYNRNYNTPFVYSLGVDYKLNKKYTLSFNTSKNFRIPTFNDLYWNFGGNPNLKPETSYQYEIGNHLKIGNIIFQINGFYIKSKNLIQWKPDAIGNWAPINVAETENYGGEASVSSIKKIKDHIFRFSANYSYTIAKNKATNKNLIYVPKHRANFSIDYNYYQLTIFYQQLINGKVVVIGDELPMYSVSNLGIDYQFTNKNFHPKLGIKIVNLWNRNYQNVQNRPMPTRNIHLTLNFKF